VNTLPKKLQSQDVDKPEKLHYSRYYEHDGALRAYANRAMILAFLCVPTTLLAVGFAVYVRLQPPTVVRVDPVARRPLSDEPSPKSPWCMARKQSPANLRSAPLCGSSSRDTSTSHRRTLAAIGLKD